MDILSRHEMFEIEVLDRMNTAKVLTPLVFGGGSMLRLCHELNRYSVDLDFWLIGNISEKSFFNKIRRVFDKDYEITDAQIKHFTLLYELRSGSYPRRLKIEIRRGQKECDYQEKIAFSRFTTRQVLLKAHTLEQTMKNKIQAFLDRGEVRDCFDIEFLLRRGIDLAFETDELSREFQKKLIRLKNTDFKVKLGSILEKDIRDYYVTHRFRFLEEKLALMASIT